MRVFARAATAGALLALAAAVLLPGAAAQAHDVLESTSPANGSTVASVPGAVVLTFDHTPIAIGTKITVTDASGADESAGDATVVDNQVTQALKQGAPAGKYTVVWRVVSSDSHPIEGTFTFTARAAGGGSGGTTAGPTGAASAPNASAPAASATPSGPTEVVGAGVPAWLIVGGTVLLLVIAALAYFVRRGLSGPSSED
ncbi:copper resistance CopC family protein [Sinomonas sp. G460-2]|uniref:copper resistance CopC family protein n=1 Tax=Sinomonas sp. G460-2 TaxID=3393464 RepID=UPI0039EF3F30